MNFLITGILSQPWAIDQSFVQSNIGLIASLLKGNPISSLQDIEFSTRHVIEPGASNISGNKTPFDQAPHGSIAVINLSGPMMKNDQFCGPVGTATIAEWAKAIDANPNFIGAIVKTDSPGGQVFGTEELARVFASTKKPFVAFVDGYAASAAYWAISGCDEIIAGGQSSIIGSIGTMCTIADISKALENEGITLHDIYATNSTAKNKAYRDAMAGDFSALTAELDSLNSVFESNVQTNRANAKLKDAVFTGAHYLSAEAKKMGLIDRIGTMQDAINSVRKLSKKQETMKQNNAQAMPAICALLGWENGFESTEEGVHIQMDQLSTIEAALVDANTTTDSLATATNDLTAANNNLQTANSTIDNLRAEIATLKEKPAHRGSNNPSNLSEETPAFKKNNTGFVPDGSEVIGAKYGMDTSSWGF